MLERSLKKIYRKCRTCNGGGHEASDVAGDERTQDEARDIRAACGHHGAHRADQNAQSAEVAEAAQRVSGHHLRLVLHTERIRTLRLTIRS